jgi:threonine dehydrogenase-like Zn-dependent dehydrogenase
VRAVTWQGREEVRVETVPDPAVREPTDAVIRVTATGICGSDLHLYRLLGPVIQRGEILGHEAIGVVEEAGSEVRHVRPGDRVVVPFNISCGACFMCEQGLQSQCETTQNRRWGKGGSLFGYTHLYGAVPGGQAERLRVPLAHYGLIPVPGDLPDERAVLLADVVPTAWQAVAYARVPAGGAVAVWGLGPIGQMCARIARHRGAGRVIGIDHVPERLAMAARHDIETIDRRAVDDVPDVLRELTDGRGPDAAIDAVGTEAAGSRVEETLQRVRLLPDRQHALRECLRSVRRGGTVSLSGVYMGPVPLAPLGNLFDRQIGLHMGQANVHRWIPDILPLMNGGDPLGTADLVTHVLPLERAPEAYETFQRKRDGAVKVVLRPVTGDPSA